MPYLLKRPSKSLKWIFDFPFSGNWFEFDTIGIDFEALQSSAIQIRVSITEFKNSQIPGIQPTYGFDPCNKISNSNQFPGN